MDQDADQLMVFDFQHVMHTIQNPPHARISRHEYAAFCDFAAGRDENCLAIRSGNKLLELISWREKDTVAATGRFIIEFRKNNLRKEQIWGDGGGIGHAMCDMLDAAGWPINRFDFGAPAGRSQAFVSRGAEIWVNLAQRIAKQEICLINDPTLISQLTTRKVSVRSGGADQAGDQRRDGSEGLKVTGSGRCSLGHSHMGCRTSRRSHDVRTQKIRLMRWRNITKGFQTKIWTTISAWNVFSAIWADSPAIESSRGIPHGSPAHRKRQLLFRIESRLTMATIQIEL